MNVKDRLKKLDREVNIGLFIIFGGIFFLAVSLVILGCFLSR